MNGNSDNDNEYTILDENCATKTEAGEETECEDNVELEEEILECEEYAELEEEILEPSSTERSKMEKSKIWQYFVKSATYGVARCMLCGESKSYKSTTGNLMSHLRRKHPLAVTSKLSPKPPKKKRRVISPENSSKQTWDFLDISECSNADKEGTGLSSLIRKQFKQNKNSAPSCAACRHTVRDTLHYMKAHLEEHHPDTLDRITTKALEAVSEEDVYLLEEMISKKEPPATSVRKTVPKNNEESMFDDTEIFLTYLKTLLRNVPKKSSRKLQVDIICLTMKAVEGNEGNGLEEDKA